MPINKPHHRPCHTPSTQNPPFCRLLCGPAPTNIRQSHQPLRLPPPELPSFGTPRQQPLAPPLPQRSVMLPNSTAAFALLSSAPFMHASATETTLLCFLGFHGGGIGGWRIACVFFFCREIDASILSVRFCGLLCLSYAWCIRRFC